MVKYLKINGNHDEGTILQMQRAMENEHVVAGVLCADGHKGYTVPIGGVIAYENAVSPSGVGYDIGCGNMAVETDVTWYEMKDYVSLIMDDIASNISFGLGRINGEAADHDVFYDPAWDLEILQPLKENARLQLGTVGGGNHFVDLFIGDNNRIWIGVHFGSRGLGHKIASYYIKEGGGRDGMDVPPVVLPLDTNLGQDYLIAMGLAGRYAYAGREWVVQRVAEILGANITYTVHNHHNFAWGEYHHGFGDVYVIRKGATPAYPGQEGFVGGSMGDMSVILEGIGGMTGRENLYSTVHGAGRVMSRSQAAGKVRWKHGKKYRKSEGVISQQMMDDAVNGFGVELRGGGRDEAPQVYRKLEDVLSHHAGTIEVKQWLKPVGVAMAGDEIDPYKD